MSGFDYRAADVSELSASFTAYDETMPERLRGPAPEGTPFIFEFHLEGTSADGKAFSGNPAFVMHLSDQALDGTGQPSEETLAFLEHSVAPFMQGEYERIVGENTAAELTEASMGASVGMTMVLQRVDRFLESSGAGLVNDFRDFAPPGGSGAYQVFQPGESRMDQTLEGRPSVAVKGPEM